MRKEEDREYYEALLVSGLLKSAYKIQEILNAFEPEEVTKTQTSILANAEDVVEDLFDILGFEDTYIVTCPECQTEGSSVKWDQIGEESFGPEYMPLCVAITHDVTHAFIFCCPFCGTVNEGEDIKRTAKEVEEG